MNTTLIRETDLRYYRLAAAFEGIPIEQQELHIAQEATSIERRQQSSSPQNGNIESRFSRLANLARVYVRTTYQSTLSHKKRSRIRFLTDEELEDTLCQAEQRIKDRPPTPPKVCCTCGQRLPGSSRARSDLHKAHLYQ